MDIYETTTDVTPVVIVYRHFLAFVYQVNGATCFANMTSDTVRPITSMEQITAKQNELRQRGYREALILSCSLLDRFEQAVEARS